MQFIATYAPRWIAVALILASWSALASAFAADTPIVVINATTGRQQQAQAADNALVPSVLKVTNTTASSGPTAGAATFGNGTAATSVAIGGGQINAGGSVHKFGTSSTGFAALTQFGNFGRFVCQDTSGAFAGDFLMLSSTNAAVRAVTSAAVSLNPNNGLEALRASAAGNLLVGITVDTGITGSGGIHSGNTTEASAIGTAANILDGGLTVAKRSFLGTIGSTFKGDVIAGVQDATAAVAGQVGEVLTSSAASVAVAATGTVGNVTSLSVTAGAWMITGSYTINQGTTGLTTGSAVNCSIVTTTATNGTQGTTMSQDSAVLAASGFKPMWAPTQTVNINATTTYFLTEQCTFAGGSPTASGQLTAVRIR